MKTITKKFQVKITQEEERSFGKLAAIKSGELVMLANEFQLVKKEWQAKIQTLNSEIYELQNSLRTGLTTKELSVEVEFDTTKRMVNYYYKGNLVESRNMTESELQLNITGDNE